MEKKKHPHSLSFNKPFSKRWEMQFSYTVMAATLSSYGWPPAPWVHILFL